jgi:hypothetical protein
MEKTFEECRIAYRVLPNLPTMTPRVTNEEGEAIRRAFATLYDISFDGGGRTFQTRPPATQDRGRPGRRRRAEP